MMPAELANAAQNAGSQPVRSCVICRRRLAKSELARYAPARDRASLVSDPAQRLPGRGFYVCDQARCQKAFIQYKGWRRKLKGVANVENQG